MRTGRPKGAVGSRELKMAPELKAWKNIKARCYTVSSNGYEHYGGRGIQVHAEWRKSYETFLAYVGKRPSPQHSLDRYPDQNGNYEPGNVRWATSKEQMRNIRVNRIVTIDGNEMTLVEAAEKALVPYNTVLYRLKRGWTIEHALSYPAHKGVKPWLNAEA